MHSILSIFFSSIEVLGKQNIPLHGPIIFSGNHMNQFVDAALILITCPYRVGFLIAEKSFNQRIIGDLAKAVGNLRSRVFNHYIVIILMYCRLLSGFKTSRPCHSRSRRNLFPRIQSLWQGYRIQQTAQR